MLQEAISRESAEPSNRCEDTRRVRPSKPRRYHCRFPWIWMKWELTLTFHLPDWNPCQISKHAHAWVTSLHLVCEPAHLMRVFLRELWHCNKQPVWCVCLIIPQLSWVEVLPVNINKGQRNHNKQKSSTLLQTFAFNHSFEVKKK